MFCLIVRFLWCGASLQYVQIRMCKPIMLNKNTLGVKKVRGQSEAALQIGMYDQKL